MTHREIGNRFKAIALRAKAITAPVAEAQVLEVQAWLVENNGQRNPLADIFAANTIHPV